MDATGPALSGVTIRQLAALEGAAREQLIDLLIAVVDDGASIGFLPPLARPEAAAFWAGVGAQLQGPGLQLFVAAQDSGAIVGTAQLHPSPRPNARHRAEVAKLMVHPAARRAGIGRALMLAVEAAARRQQRTLLVLDTREGDASHHLYHALGYQQAGRIPRYCMSPGGRLDATIIYFKDLPDR